MSTSVSVQPIPPLLRVLRMPLVVGALVAILGYSLALVTLVPNYGFIYRWRADGGLWVRHTLSAPAAEHLQPGDRILAMDGQPVRRSPWRLLFMPGRENYTYDIDRNGQHLRVTVPVGPLHPGSVRRRLTAGTVALGAWGVGTVILLLAAPRNRDAWRVGLVTLGLAVALAASEAALYSIPTAWLLADPWMPLLAVAFAQLALVPAKNPASRFTRAGFTMLYSLAFLLGALLLFDMLVLLPRGESVYSLTGLVLNDWLLAAVGVGLLLNPLLLVVRSLLLPPSPQRHATRLLLFFTALAVLPLVLLTMLPRVLVGAPLLPWAAGLGLLLLLPTGYGYVIYRHRYLRLDLIATRALTLMGLTLLFLLLHGLLSLGIARLVGPAASAPLSQATAAVAAFLLVMLAGQRLEQISRTLVFGASAALSGRVGAYAARLARHPESQTLAAVFAEMVDLLDVHAAALLLCESNGMRMPIFCRGVEDAGRMETMEVPPALWMRGQGEPTPPPGTPAGIHLVAPLISDGQPVGVALLGPKVPDEQFDALEVAFVEQVVGAMAVTATSIRLFEASRAMSRQLLQIQQQERAALAAQLHDDPLQRLTWIAAQINDLAHRVEEPATLVEALHQQQRDVLGVVELIRAVCAELHSPLLAQGLGLAVQEVLANVEAESDLVVRAQIALHPEQILPDAVTTAVYHVLREALNNVRKHAHASGVDVTLCCMEERLTLTVADDGRGLAASTLSLSDLLRAHHFGLVGMHEWARLVEGDLSLTARPPRGTQIRLVVPLPHDATMH